jgi:hypothetical protein
MCNNDWWAKDDWFRWFFQLWRTFYSWSGRRGIHEVDEEVPRTKLISLVLDMCPSLYYTGWVANMDNYYTSPQVAVALAERKVYIRGTCRANRAGFPPAMQYSRTEAAKVERGTHKMVSDENYGIACYGWIDGNRNTVHFLTSADGMATNEVSRRVGWCDKKVQAPICIKRYNHGMQAVDRHDQLVRQTFSLASRHGFKKYYVQIMLGLMDMALVNAYIHYKLVNEENSTKDSARYEFMESLANALLTTDCDNFANSGSGMSNDSIFEAIVQQDKPFRKGQSPRTKPKGKKQRSLRHPIRVVSRMRTRSSRQAVTKRMDLYAKCEDLRSVERGYYPLLFVLNTVYVCVPEAMHRKRFLKRMARRSQTTVGWHRTTPWVAGRRLILFTSLKDFS